MIVALALLAYAAAVVFALHWFGTVAAAQRQEAERLERWQTGLTQWATLLAAHESGRCHSTAECIRNCSVFPVEVGR